jgi:hypothetical protein
VQPLEHYIAAQMCPTCVHRLAEAISIRLAVASESPARMAASKIEELDLDDEVEAESLAIRTKSQEEPGAQEPGDQEPGDQEPGERFCLCGICMSTSSDEDIFRSGERTCFSEDIVR